MTYSMGWQSRSDRPEDTKEHAITEAKAQIERNYINPDARRELLADVDRVAAQDFGDNSVRVSGWATVIEGAISVAQAISVERLVVPGTKEKVVEQLEEQRTA